MSIKISDDFMCLEIGGVVIATATKRADGWWSNTGRLHQDHHRPGRSHRCGGRCGHLLSPRLRAGQQAWRDRADRVPRPVHRGWPHPGGEHADPRRQPAHPARTIPGALVPGGGRSGHRRRQPGTRPRPRPHRSPGQRLARAGAGWFCTTSSMNMSITTTPIGHTGPSARDRPTAGPTSRLPTTTSAFRRRDRLGGLIHEYSQVA